MPGLEDELGDIVRKARSGLGIEIQALAQRAGMSEREIKSLEVYTFRPTEQQTRALAAALHLRADQLWDIAEESWSAPEVPWSVGGQLMIDCLTNDYPEHCYIITNGAGACLIVDPGDEAERIVQTATANGRWAAAILITHRHQDHTGAVIPVQKATGAPVYIHKDDIEGVQGVPRSSVRTFGANGDLGVADFRIGTLHTPGHTPGSATFVFNAGDATAAFCGDTLFAGSAGNARAGYDTILSSLRDMLAKLPPQTVFYPGHGPATTLKNEVERNPFL